MKYKPNTDSKKVKTKKKVTKIKKIYKSESKQKIVLKIPSMISVTIENPIFQIGNESNSSDNLSGEIKDKLRSKAKSTNIYLLIHGYIS